MYILDCGDIIYHNQRPDLMSLLEQVQYRTALIVSGCWQGTSRDNLHDGLGWESLCIIIIVEGGIEDYLQFTK